MKGKSMKKKLILFDWGNIVESHSTGYTCYDAFNDLFFACGYDGKGTVFNQLGKYRLSCIRTEEEFKKVFLSMKEEFHFNKTYDEFKKLYLEIFDKIEYYKDVAKFEWSLKDRCSIGILSDLTLFDKVRLDKQVDLSKYDYVFLSFELGLKKPERPIYEEVQKRVPFKPQDILFIDDRENNIETAKEMGWCTLQATGLELAKIKEKCEEFLNS